MSFTESNTVENLGRTTVEPKHDTPGWGASRWAEIK